jgi:hypothetical protein
MSGPETTLRSHRVKDININHSNEESKTMPKYLIERTLPGAGNLSRDDLRAASENSNGVLAELGPEIQWVHSYVTDDKITCVYVAPDEEVVREHARRAGLPADVVMPIRTRIDPTTAERDAQPVTAGAGSE